MTTEELKHCDRCTGLEAAYRDVEAELHRWQARAEAAEAKLADLQEQVAHKHLDACPLAQAAVVEVAGPLRRRVEALERALRGLSPHHTKRGPCWCEGSDSGGHSEACDDALAALAAGRKP